MSPVGILRVVESQLFGRCIRDYDSEVGELLRFARGILNAFPLTTPEGRDREEKNVTARALIFLIGGNRE